MIPYNRDTQQTIPTSAVKIIGLGGAGANMLERVALDGLDGAELLALNTDVRTLNGCVANEKIQLGRNLTKGLGAGGDPELGLQAVLEAEEEVRAALRGRRIIFLCTGLGGGTGSGAASIITRIAREEGAFVVVFATMPFAFEGRRRRDQADTALNELAVLSNALVTFDNNRMGELVVAKQGIHEAFSAADHMICESIKAVIRLVVRPGLINIGLDDLMSALRTNRSRCLFGSGIAKGTDRASRALRNALASPLLDQGALLKEAQTVLVHLSGGEDLTLFEIELLMQALQKFVPEKAHVLFGAAVDPAMGESLSITLISALPEDSLAIAPRESISFSAEEPVVGPVYRVPSIEAKPRPEPVAVVPVVAAAAVEPVFQAPAPAPAREPVAPGPFEPVFEAVPASAVPEPVAVVAETPAPAAPEPAFFAEEAPPAEPEPATDAAPVAAPSAPEETFVAQEAPAPAATPAPEPSAVIKDSPDPFSFVDEPPTSAAPAGVADPQQAPKPFTFELPQRRKPTDKVLWGSQDKPAPAKPADDPFQPAPQPVATLEQQAPEATPETPKLKLGLKPGAGQSELSFDSSPRGRFEGETPNVFEGEDLDLPPFLRKKR